MLAVGGERYMIHPPSVSTILLTVPGAVRSLVAHQASLQSLLRIQS